MQNLPIAAFPNLALAQAAVDPLDGLSPEEPALVSFEALLKNQIQAQSVAPAGDPAALIAADPLASPPAMADFADRPRDTTALSADLAAVMAALAPAAAPTEAATSTEAAAPTGVAVPADMAAMLASAIVGGALMPPPGFTARAVVPAKGEGAAALGEVRRNTFAAGDVLPLAQGGGVAAGAAEIAGTGKDLPLAIAKPELAVAQPGAQGVDLGHAPPADMDLHAVRTDLPFQLPGVQADGIQASRHAPTVVALEPRVGVPGWGEALGQKIVWLANQHHMTAELQLNPPNLGPLEVKLTVANDQATALFVSHQAVVRDAIESALPRLREMLAESGIALGDVQVSAESFQRETASGHGEGRRKESNGLFGEITETGGGLAGVMRLPARGLVDTFV